MEVTQGVEPAGRERRRNTRIDFDSSVELTNDRVSIRAVSPFNISLGGVGVLADQSMQLGEECNVAIFFNGASADLSIKARGEVVRCVVPSEDGTDAPEWDIAIRFKEIGDDSYFLLHNLILYNADDPDAVEAEF